MEGRRWLEAALARSEGLGRTKVRGHLLHRAGAMVGWYHEEFILARTRIEAAVALCRELEDDQELAFSLCNLCMMASSLGDHAAALASAAESVALWRKLGDRLGLHHSLYFLGNVLLKSGDLAAARASYRESHAIALQLGDRYNVARPVAGLAQVALLQGDTAAARAFYEETVALRREQNDVHIGRFLEELAAITRDQGDLTAARSLWEEALALHRKIGYPPGIARTLAGVGTVARDQGDWETACSCFEQSLAVIQAATRERGDHWRQPTARETAAECLEGLAGIAVSEIEAAQGEPSGAPTRSPGRREARFEWATRLLAAAAALREDCGAPASPLARARNEHQEAFLRSVLGEAAFSAAWAAGQAMTLPQAVEIALGGDRAVSECLRIEDVRE
jgi:tetratricopeptide (TPR) repeat protein